MQDLPPTLPNVSEVVVEARGPATGIGSGVIHFGVLIFARDEHGVMRVFVETEMGAGQLFPAIGARCTFDHVPRSVDFVSGVQYRPDTQWSLIVRSSCDELSPIESPG